MRIEDLAAYEIISRQKIQDLRSEGYLLRHKKSGARIALLSNEDENKVFYIGFKTPSGGQHRCCAYSGAFRSGRLKGISGQRPFLLSL